MQCRMKPRLLLVHLVSVILVTSAKDTIDTLLKVEGHAQRCSFESCPKEKNGVLNIHFIPYFHGNVAWTKTFDANIDVANEILVSVSGEILKQKRRMFTIPHVALFKRWYEDTNEVFRIVAKKFVYEGRLEFTGGGWVEHDEATTDYASLIDQMTLGHRWVNETFGECMLPTAAWQLDSYGHSKQTAALFAEHGRKYQAYYSTPSCYLRSLSRINVTWNTYNGDFFPYFDGHDFYTGFYTTRPAFKLFARYSNNYLQACKQVTVLANISADIYKDLAQSVALAQDHNVITGTSVLSAMTNMTHLLSKGISLCEEILTPGLEALVTVGKNRNFFPRFCHLLNQSECQISEGKEKFFVVVYNTNSSPLRTIVRFPVGNSGYKVTSTNDRIIPSEVLPIQHAILHVPGRQGSALHELVFLATAPSLGISTYKVERFRGSTIERATTGTDATDPEEYILRNKWYEVTVDAKTCLMKTVRVLDAYTTVDFRQFFAAYQSNLGHYIFRPTSATVFIRNITCRFVKTSIVEEIHQWVNPWMSQVIRLYASEDFIEFDWIVGPIPTEHKGSGFDVVTRFKSDLENEGIFYTDSNAGQSVKRITNSSNDWSLDSNRYRVAANYYPVVSWIYMKSSDLQITVIPDRPQGGTVFHSGEIELMVHRRHGQWDSDEIGEPLNDQGVDKRGQVLRGRHLLHMGKVDHAASRLRDLLFLVLRMPVLAFADATSPKARGLVLRMFTGLGVLLPMGVRILSLERLPDENKVMVRFEYLRLEEEYNLDGKLDEIKYRSKVNVPLKGLLTTYNITKLRETGLTASRWFPGSSNYRQHHGNLPQGMTSKARSGDIWENNTYVQIELRYGEIRTFVGEM
ncbi:lysosomal alpha-mannosidase-like isoform X2 [Ornithodoros turicata]|uniref:lysosomal alpha-mannosidase-like isoform X2 n=1 Tax=Ornithodoros turicata TaxID=34597 RepID=UPI0031397171